jgi:transketolase
MNNLDHLKILASRAAQLRIDSIRSTSASNSGHPTSSMSSAEIVASLFFHEMKFDYTNPESPDNDRFILSKGHAAPVLYSAWKQLGLISDSELLELRQINSRLEGHPTRRHPLGEAATGSLGQGLAIGIGMAIYSEQNKIENRIFILMGDGEIAEGSVWEAANLASHKKLKNLVAIVDCNELGQTGATAHGQNIEVYADRFRAFGWHTDIVDGHNINEILNALSAAKNFEQPSVILARTIKGKGLLEVEGKNGFHGKTIAPEKVEAAILEISKGMEAELEAPAKIVVSNRKKTESKCINLQAPDFDRNISTREAFGLSLARLGKINDKIVVLDGDVSNSTFTKYFEQALPSRFIQCFIAEQSMVGIATGMNSRGAIPFVATFAAFLSRAHDQIRMAAIGKQPLRIIGSHSGISIGYDGPSQMGMEDIAMMRSLPNSIVLYPSDGVSSYKLTQEIANYSNGISYLRTTRMTTAAIYNKNEEFPIGGLKVLRQSSYDKITVVAAGATLHESLRAAQILEEREIYICVVDLYSIKPMDTKTLSELAFKSNGKILTVEDHYPEGGIGEAVLSALAGLELKVYTKAVEILPRSGKPEELMSLAKIDSQSIVEAILELI